MRVSAAGELCHNPRVQGASGQVSGAAITGKQELHWPSSPVPPGQSLKLLGALTFPATWQYLQVKACVPARLLQGPRNNSSHSLLCSTYFIRFRTGQITTCTKWRPHYSKQRTVGSSSISIDPEAFGRSVGRAGWGRGALTGHHVSDCQGRIL